MSKLRMDAYYYSFAETGVEEIDKILSAVATAGKMYHHTDQWSDKDSDGKSCIDEIQEAAKAAANSLDKGRRAISLLKELRSQISDYNGHGNPGCPDRASAVIALAHTDKFLKEYDKEKP